MKLPTRGHRRIKVWRQGKLEHRFYRNLAFLAHDLQLFEIVAAYKDKRAQAKLVVGQIHSSQKDNSNRKRRHLQASS